MRRCSSSHARKQQHTRNLKATHGTPTRTEAKPHGRQASRKPSHTEDKPHGRQATRKTSHTEAKPKKLYAGKRA
ncbi:hypothetical protein Pmani_040070 [Petrolisthes manimaculis]|uniref:Uncharacterized protein n=1 Tax=Petrolisthes manimaculis TaxID=1843537 RepID=A0AAE1NCN3_9EUCA|nr:hypothetical protein Pmani_040070 [Petrolisthes manimaculis]